MKARSSLVELGIDAERHAIGLGGNGVWKPSVNTALSKTRAVAMRCLPFMLSVFDYDST